MPFRFAQRAPATEQRSTVRRAVTALLVATLCAFAIQIAPGSPFESRVSADSPPVPKAVFIVGPTGGLTDSNLADAEKMAKQAEAAGMEVRRVFFPNATWDNVLANIQGASLVVYMGHGYGWPSKYTRTLTESRQNGMGLNSFVGSGKSEYKYYGATPIRASVRLAPNAVVILNHLCYASGNAEPGMAFPDEELARERVDNFASGWLAVGARAVFAYGWWQRLNYPQALMTTNQTMDELFMTPADGSPKGFVGQNNVRFDSHRTPGATNHLDPHPRYGYYRAASGNLEMTAAEFRSSATGSAPGTAPPPGDGTTDAPQITSLVAAASGAVLSATADTRPASFHPNGDGLDDDLVLTHEVTRAATLGVTITNADGAVVRTMTVTSPRGTSTSRWDGRNSAGGYVADGTYTLTYVPRDSAGATGSPVSTSALVLSAVKLGKPSVPAFFARDADSLSKFVKLGVTLNQQAHITWHIVDGAGRVVRTVRSDASMPAGLTVFRWDGRADDGSWAADGRYRSVVSARTSLGSYSQERSVYAGAFRMTPSTSSPARGGKLTLTIVTTEALSGAPRVTLAQPGVEPVTVATTKVARRKFKVTVTLSGGGDAGTLTVLVGGTDKYGGTQESGLNLVLR